MVRGEAMKPFDILCWIIIVSYALTFVGRIMIFVGRRLRKTTPKGRMRLMLDDVLEDLHRAQR